MTHPLRELVKAADLGNHSAIGPHFLGSAVIANDRDLATHGPSVTCWSGEGIGEEKAQARARFIVEAATAIDSLLDEVEGLTRERDEAQRALRVVQGAAKTLASAQGTELEHLRQNATFDHRLRVEHQSLIDRDAQMTDALLAAEARAERLESSLKAILEWWPEGSELRQRDKGGSFFVDDIAAARLALSDTNGAGS